MAGSLVAAAVLRAINLTATSVWLDEANSYFIAAKPIAEILPTLRHATNSPPLFLYLLHFALQLDQSEVGMRLVSWLFGCLLVPATYASTILLLGSRPVAVLHALLALCSAFLIYYSQEARMYSLFGFLSALSLGFFYVALASGGKRYAKTAAVLTLLNLLTHYFAVFLLAGQVLFAIADIGWHRRWSQWRLLARRLVVPFAVVGAAYAVIMLPYVNATSSPAAAAGNPELFSIRYVQLLVDIFTSGAEPVWLFPALFAVGLVSLLLDHRRIGAYLSLVVATGVVVVPLFLEQRSFWTQRYYTFLVPAVFTIIAYGLFKVFTWVRLGLRRWSARGARAAALAAVGAAPLVSMVVPLQAHYSQGYAAGTMAKYPLRESLRLVDRDTAALGRGVMFTFPLSELKPVLYYHRDDAELAHSTVGRRNRGFERLVGRTIDNLPIGAFPRLLEYPFVVVYARYDQRADPNLTALERFLAAHFDLKMTLASHKFRRSVRIYVAAGGEGSNR